MVLDDASPQAGDFSSQDGSPSTAVPTPGRQKYIIKPETIVRPDPFTLYFGFFGQKMWQLYLGKTVIERAEFLHGLLQRPAAQEEMDALATLTSRFIYQSRIGTPLGGIFSSWFLYHQAKRHPVYQAMVPGVREGKTPGPRELMEGLQKFAKTDPAMFRSTVGVALLRVCFWTITGTAASTLWAGFNDAKGRQTDPRLAEYQAAVQANNSMDPAKQRRVQEAVERSRQAYAKSQRGEDFPTADETSGYAQQRSDSWYAGENMESPSIPGRIPRHTPSRQMYGTAGSQFDGGGREQDPVSEFFDDASPTAPEYQKSDRVSGPVFQRGAWDRIRAQNTNNSYAQPEQFRTPSDWNTQSSSSGGATSGNNADQERQREKEKARADFERMLDSERAMSTDDSSNAQSGGQRGWWGRR